jgi:MFS family permease
MARPSELSPKQWKSGIAAWLGWLFDGLELHIYTLVAGPLVVGLLGAASSADPAVKEKSAYIQAAFLIGWAVGGAFFGRLGDRLGRSRTLALTVLTYALCTGLCAFARTWWQLMIFRFVAALGIGGEWAVGACLLAETWPVPWRPWLAAVLQTAVNVGILIAASAVTILSVLPHPPPVRFVFLIGVLPALMVFWIRRSVPEPDSWKQAAAAAPATPRVRDLFRADLARTTWHTTAVCALGLSGWWLFIFWHPQHLRQLLEAAGTPPAEITRRVASVFFAVNVLSIAGNFAAGWLASVIGTRRAIILMLFGLFAGMAGAYAVPHTYNELATFWVPMVGFFSGLWGLFTMYLPPLFPTLLRTTGAGFCYNVGRAAAAVASVVFGWLAPVGDFRLALLASSFLALAAALWAFALPREVTE